MAQIEQQVCGVSGRIGLLLSAGIDSAILASYLPSGSVAYTLYYDDNKNEIAGAAEYVKEGVIHKPVLVTRDSFLDANELLIREKRMPTVPHEASIFIACLEAQKDGVTNIVTGVGADGRFGGFGYLYKVRGAKRFHTKIKTNVDPAAVLVEPEPVEWAADQFRGTHDIDVQRFLSTVGTEGNAIETAIRVAGLNPILPYAMMKYSGRFDIERIVSGDEKYLLKGIFSRLYPKHLPRKKKALEVPVRKWLPGYRPSRPEFREGMDMKVHSGKQAFLIYSLERYLEYRDQMGWKTPDPT